MKRLVIVVALVSLLLGAGAFAADQPMQHFGVQLQNIATRVGVARANVKSALSGKDFADWCRMHDAFVRELTRGQTGIESACGQLMLSTLAAGEDLNTTTLEAIDVAAAEAANLARHRVIVQAYAKLTREGVRYDKRCNALALLQKQGIYEPDAGATGVATATLTGGTPPPIDDDPMHGKIPGNTEAAQYLSLWQTAVMKAQGAGRRMAALEADLAGLAPEDPRVQKAEQSLAASQQQYANLLRQADELRKKYYGAGGQ